MTTELKKTLNVWSGTAMALNLVIGAGLLIVPGIAYNQVGTSSIYAWLINAIVAIPFLIIFANLGARFPSAGGISGFTQIAFGRNWAASTEILMLGTFSLALPAVSFTGAAYFSEVFAWNETYSMIVAFLMLLFAIVINLIGVKLSARFQQFLSYSLFVILVLVSISVFFLSPLKGSGIAPVSEWKQSIPVLGLVFFAYAGWEILAFTSEEYKNPKRDFPRVIFISYVLVIILYLLIVVSLQSAIKADHPDLIRSPIALLFKDSLGGLSSLFVSICGFVIILAHLLSAIWGASRLMYSSAREKMLPSLLARHVSSSGVPIASVITVGGILILVGIACAMKWVSTELLFTLAGQNFFLLSAFAVLSYMKLAETKKQFLLGIITSVVVLFIIFSFGTKLIYPIVLVTSGFLISKYFRK
jgi:amino acid efflux transporter